MNGTWRGNDFLVTFFSNELALPLATSARGSGPANIPDADYACRKQVAAECSPSDAAVGGVRLREASQWPQSLSYPRRKRAIFSRCSLGAPYGRYLMQSSVTREKAGRAN